MVLYRNHTHKRCRFRKYKGKHELSIIRVINLSTIYDVKLLSLFIVKVKSIATILHIDLRLTKKFSSTLILHSTFWKLWNFTLTKKIRENSMQSNIALNALILRNFL